MYFPNKRGKATRSNDRNTRYATHTPVLKSCIEALSSSVGQVYAIEHGMGLASTPFIHQHPAVVSMVSLEREPEWARCDTCSSGSNKPHVVKLVRDGEERREALVAFEENGLKPESTVGLVDGFAWQRVHVLWAWMELGVSMIVEHDAETLSEVDVAVRRRLSRSFGYRAVQFTGLNPETLFFVKDNAARVPLEDTRFCQSL